jgi:predicted XRE-type DNA-binding protein
MTGIYQIRNQKNGKLYRAKKSHKAKLTNLDVIKIRILLERKVKQKIIASQFGVNKATISDIKTGKTWSHI